MNSKETKALTKAIERYISKHIYRVKAAQIYAKQIEEAGLMDGRTSMPFQIIPTELSDEDGDLICKLFVNIEHPAHGFFSLELLDDQISMSCPVTYHTDHLLMTYEMCDSFILDLSNEMDEFYKLQSAVEEKQVVFCQLFINQLLSKYKKNITFHLEKIKNYVNKQNNTAIVSNNHFALVKDAQRSYDKALIMPGSWVIFAETPDKGEDLNDYIDEEATEQLIAQLNKFFRQENFLASGIYLAQRICLQAGLKVEGFSSTEEEWQEAKINLEMGEFVLPPIDISEFRINNALE
jgi:hypothetical protein